MDVDVEVDDFDVDEDGDDEDLPVSWHNVIIVIRMKMAWSCRCSLLIFSNDCMMQLRIQYASLFSAVF